MIKGLGVFFAMMLMAGGALAAEAPVEVGAGQSVLLRLDRPARQVVVGDPTVADVSVPSPNLIVVFGKRAGATSLTVLDGGRAAVLETPVVVRPGGPGTVTVTYGAGKDVKPGGDTVVFACASNCVRGVEAKAAAATAKAAGN